MNTKLNNSKNKKFTRNSRLSRGNEGKFETRNYILYLDTSESEAVLAIYKFSKRSRPRTVANLYKKIGEIKWQAGRELSRTLSQKYSNVLKNVRISSEDLAGICVFVGPGSFTGLRIGISFANGLAYALGIPIYETKKRGTIDLARPKKIAVPFYGSEPKITKPKAK